MIVALPDANQKYREILFGIVTQKVESDVKPRVFFQDFPNWVLYPRNDAEPGQAGWSDVLLANTSKPDAVELYMARRGQIVLDPGEANGPADPDRRHQLRDRRAGRVEHHPVPSGARHPPRSEHDLSADGSRARPDREDDCPVCAPTSTTRCAGRSLRTTR